LADDKEFIDAIKEASHLASGNQLRRLFVSFLIMNTMSKLNVVWDASKAKFYSISKKKRLEHTRY